MPTYSHSKPAQLRARLQELNEALETREPDLMAELKLVERLLQAYAVGTPSVYAQCKGPTEAIELCLDVNGDFTLTKKQISEEILQGGYVTDKPKTDRYIMNDVMNQRVKRGLYMLRDEKLGRIKAE